MKRLGDLGREPMLLVHVLYSLPHSTLSLSPTHPPTHSLLDHFRALYINKLKRYFTL